MSEDDEIVGYDVAAVDIGSAKTPKGWSRPLNGHALKAAIVTSPTL